MNAVLKAATDHLVHASGNDGITTGTLDRHSRHIADAISLVAQPEDAST